MAAPTARTSVWRNDSQTNTALSPSDTTMRSAFFIGGRRVPRSPPGDKSLLVVRLPGRVRGLARHTVGAGEPLAQVDRFAAGRAKGEGRVLFARLDRAAAARTAHAQ